jgi:hypothetical protein
MIKKFNEDLLRLSGLLKEDTEEEFSPTEEEFNKNSLTYLQKLSKDAQLHFAVLCSKAVLPIWENWANSQKNLTPEQKAIPRNAVKTLEKNQSPREVRAPLYTELPHSPSIPDNCIWVIRMALHIVSENKFNGSHLNSIIRYMQQINEITSHQIYEFYKQVAHLDKMQNHFNPTEHLSSDVKELAKAAYFSGHDPIDSNFIIPLIDALRESNFNHEDILKNLEQNIHNIHKSNPIFKMIISSLNSSY